jgi:hypothetical protein
MRQQTCLNSTKYTDSLSPKLSMSSLLFTRCTMTQRMDDSQWIRFVSMKWSYLITLSMNKKSTIEYYKPTLAPIPAIQFAEQPWLNKEKIDARTEVRNRVLTFSASVPAGWSVKCTFEPNMIFAFVWGSASINWIWTRTSNVNLNITVDVGLITNTTGSPLILYVI